MKNLCYSFHVAHHPTNSTYWPTIRFLSFSMQLPKMFRSNKHSLNFILLTLCMKLFVTKINKAQMHTSGMSFLTLVIFLHLL